LLCWLLSSAFEELALPFGSAYAERSAKEKNAMNFKYFENPRAFAYMAESGHACHFCKATDNCLDGAHFFGQDEIDVICFSCMQAGRLIELVTHSGQAGPCPNMLGQGPA